MCPLAGPQSATILDYFARNSAPCPGGANPAEHIIETIQDKTEAAVDWVDVWNKSPEREKALEKLRSLNQEALARTAHVEQGTSNFATSKWFQWQTVLKRQMIQLWRSPVCLPTGDTSSPSYCFGSS